MQSQGFIDIGTASLEYRWLSGSNELPALVLLHEGLGCVEMWKDFPQQLAANTNCAVFSYSRQGYGRSSPAELPRPAQYMHDEAKTLSRVLHGIPAESFILVGHSDGASIASIYAGNHPQVDVRGLILLAPHFFVEELSLVAIEKVKQIYVDGDLRNRLEKYHGNQVDAVFRGWNDVWLSKAFKHWDIRQYLPEIAIDSLIIQGDSDEYGSQAQIDAAQQLIPASVTTRILQDCGHSPHIQFQRQTVEAIVEFINRLNN